MSADMNSIGSWREHYREMVLIRLVEQELAKLFAAGEIPGFIHLSVGQEAVPVGICSALSDVDTVASNHRGHGHALAKGVNLERFFLEIFGKDGGQCRGLGGSMHIADMSVGMLGANGIVGAGLSLALGSALAHRIRRTGGVAVVFFGDGALASGLLHETLNMAQLWRAPLMFVCENNGWSEFSKTAQQFVTDPIRLASAYGIPAETVDGNDVIAVAQLAASVTELLRAGKGPAVVECRTKRVRGHFEGDPQKYRNPTDLKTLDQDDPISRLGETLRAAGEEQKSLDALQAELHARIGTAIVAARVGKEPSPGDMVALVYSPATEHTSG